jgi:hypothetical protein
MLDRMSSVRTGGARAESQRGFIHRISSTLRVIGGIAALVVLALWSLNGFAFHSSPQLTALAEVIYQNTPGNSQGLPVGLSWNRGASSTKKLMGAPAGFSALTAWAQVYQQSGVPVSPDNASDTVQVQDFTTYILLTTGTWVEAQSQAQSGVSGAHYVADFSDDAHIPFNVQKLPDGSASIDAPPAGYNNHFWPTGTASFTPGTVAGVFVEARMKTNDRNANLVAQLGADWWRYAGAPYAGVNVNNIAVGINDWTKLTTQWKALYFTTLSAQQLEANPPPKLLSSPRFPW